MKNNEEVICPNADCGWLSKGEIGQTNCPICGGELITLDTQEAEPPKNAEKYPEEIVENIDKEEDLPSSHDLHDLAK